MLSLRLYKRYCTDYLPVMENKSPEQVLQAVSKDLKFKGLTHEQAAKELGFGSRQTLSNLLSSKKYMSGRNAKRFKDAFGYDMDYLMSGKGGLYPDGNSVKAGVESIPPTMLKDVLLKYSSMSDGLYNQPSVNRMELVLHWFLTFFQRQNNIEGMKFWYEVNRFVHAEDVATMKMWLSKKKDEPMEIDFGELLESARAEIFSVIDEFLKGVEPLVGKA